MTWGEDLEKNGAIVNPDGNPMDIPKERLVVEDYDALEKQIRAEERAKILYKIRKWVPPEAIWQGDGEEIGAMVKVSDLLAFLDNLGLEESK